MDNVLGQCSSHGGIQSSYRAIQQKHWLDRFKVCNCFNLLHLRRIKPPTGVKYSTICTDARRVAHFILSMYAK